MGGGNGPGGGNGLGGLSGGGGNGRGVCACVPGWGEGWSKCGQMHT